jgi:hypothetical protein
MRRKQLLNHSCTGESLYIIPHAFRTLECANIEAFRVWTAYHKGVASDRPEAPVYRYLSSAFCIIGSSCLPSIAMIAQALYICVFNNSQQPKFIMRKCSLQRYTNIDILSLLIDNLPEISYVSPTILNDNKSRQ